MKKIYIAVSDLHAREIAPKYRIDNYFETWTKKVKFIAKTANKYNATTLIAGDIFDTPKIYPKFLNKVAHVFTKFNEPPLVIAGQHDLRYHTDFYNSPLYTLHIAGLVKYIGEPIKDTDTYVTGVSWECNVPNNSNILLIHKPITPKKPPFYLIDAISAKQALKKYKTYSLIISGDYHVPFIKTNGVSVLVNTGTIIRNKKDMVEFVPYLWKIVYDTNKQIVNSVDKIEIPHKKYDKVFDIESIERSKQHGVHIDTTAISKLVKKANIKAYEFDSVLPTVVDKLHLKYATKEDIYEYISKHK